MSTGDWKVLQADIRNSLKIGQENGETMIDVVTRIVWLERHRNQIRIWTLNEILRGVNGDPSPGKKSAERTIDMAEWRKSGNQVVGKRRRSAPKLS